ncbi:MAG: YghX family hydrolase [Vicinamibacterales bacterium]
MERLHASQFDPALLELFDRYVHGEVDRRQFIEGAGRFATGTLTAAALVEALSPDYAWAQQVAKDDPRITAEYVTYASPEGYGQIRALLVRPKNAAGKLPGVVVVHENRGLNPYVEDVARRLGTAGFMALAPDALTSVGGYPGNDDKGRELQSTLDGKKLLEDFVAAAVTLKSRPDCTGKVGVVGFCYGGGVANRLAVRLPDLAAAVPFYGGQPTAEEAARIKAPLLIHYAGLDDRVNAGWPAYEAALKANGVSYTTYIYDGVNHGFHNDTTPRYDKAAATLAWDRTVAFFNKNLK